MIKFKSEIQLPPRRHRARWLLPLLLLVPVVALVEEHWRGHWELQSWKHDMAAKGENFDAAQLWPPVTAQSIEFSNQLAGVVKELPGRLRDYGASINTIILEGSGRARRGSQESLLAYNRQAYFQDPGFTWQDLDALLQQNRSALRHLRELMKDPPAGISYNVEQRLEGDPVPNFIVYRVAAQTLQASAMNNLHKGNLESARQDLEALLSFGKLGEKDPGLTGFMIRMAIIGLSVDVCWDALQADGWTEPQLAALQGKCLDVTNVLSQLPRALEAERIERICRMNWFRTHNYQEVVARYQNRYAGFVIKPAPADIAAPVRLWRQWFFHPLWSFAWADQEQLKYLQDVQPEVAALRDASGQPSWVSLKEETSANHENYRAPVAAWRFYTKLPLAESFDELTTGSIRQDSKYPYADYSKAWFWTMRNLTLHETVITAIAIKRYELKHGKDPVDLTALVPEFLPALPPDLMDGQSLRHRLQPDGIFTVYSVGENAFDDGGAGAPDPVDNRVGYLQPWTGKDWVWPQVVKGVNNSQVANAMARSSGK
jgi:hypothetical protein